MMKTDSKIYVAGHRGMVGSAIVRELKKQGYTNIITRTHKELDLCRQADVEAFFEAERPEYVFLHSKPATNKQDTIYLYYNDYR
jgi:GDP-L-fucose synthase